MSSAETKVMTVEASKEISAPVERVFKAWTDPSEMKNWYQLTGPDDIQIKQDLRVGGEYRLADAAQAHRDLESRRTTGKLVLTVP